MSKARRCDFLVAGAGIVGLATALELQRRHKAASVTVIEKEDAVALHQTGRNSGVIHAGIYYAPGSLKARFCREGQAETVAFCDEHAIPYEICGKLIVARDETERERLSALHARSMANNLPVSLLSGTEARTLEPNIATVGALLSPTTGIVDYGRVAVKMAALFTGRGGVIETGASIIGGIERANVTEVRTSKGAYECAKAVFCCGLHADRVAAMFGAPAQFRIVPFRGEYFALANQKPDLVGRLIYPVPNPERPFLGVHLTRKIGGGFTVGPNAVLAFKREGYQKTDISVADMTSSLLYPGFWRLIARNFGPAIGELQASAFRALYLRQVQRYCAHIRAEDLMPYRAGVRAQAVAPDGRLIDDFLFSATPHTLHVCNAPSPAATAALPIARHIVDQLEKRAV